MKRFSVGGTVIALEVDNSCATSYLIPRPKLKACVRTRQIQPWWISIGPFRGKVVEVYGIATLLALVLFYLHVMVIFDVLGELLQHKTWMLEHLGLNHTGKTILLVSFCTHVGARRGVRGLGRFSAGNC